MASEGDKGYETYHTESPAHRYLTSLLPEAWSHSHSFVLQYKKHFHKRGDRMSRWKKAQPIFVKINVNSTPKICATFVI
jgi:hypothetical protein